MPLYHPQYEFPELYLYENETTLKGLHGQRYLTDSITKKSIDVIKRNKNHPFFLYISHPQPYVLLYTHLDFIGSQSRGMYGDVIHEIDDSFSRFLKTLQEKTIIIFMSDNGPWLSYGTHSGSLGIYSEGKGIVWEGDVRVPSIVWYQTKSQQINKLNPL
ncbi:MAG: sulfatase-like hydrolase/transferase [Flavobacteriaceae bacterium]|nr:sulfatase-like hydrolase/transferase [Flavobacteriaceae bacterium]MCY4267250.1 sulfatase-like hydrolase/transferase [Flavobacteriaceae bacterium]MCY4299519.1 sulfatase-like hydrolase/transferase [Flavobacteriaceae bacterium]